LGGAELTQRLAAILAADAAGYSRLMAGNERATVIALDAARAVFRTQIGSNQGRVVDTAGDSVLAVFQTAIGAVLAALAIQRELQALVADVPEELRLRFRVGLHLGDVIEKTDGTVYGDGVNIASRLQGLAEPGSVMVSESIRSAVRGKVEIGFVDQGEQVVKNIPEPVHAYSLTRDGISNRKSRSISNGIDMPLSYKPSIAVLPFTNMSGDAEQEYFSDGITEDIITELSRFHDLSVIARNSAFAYKGKAVDVRTVAKDLGVRYILEGSIRKDASRIRVTAQLIDALTGNHLWAEKHDRTLQDIFAVQEELTHSIVSAIAPHVQDSEFEKARRRRPESVVAYEIAMCARAKGWEAYLKSDRKLRDEAIAEARAALTIDDRSTTALVTLAFAQWQHLVFASAADRQAAWEDGMAAATRAIELDRSEALAYSFKGLLLLFGPDRDRTDSALQNLRRGHELNPHDTGILTALAMGETAAGNAHAAIAQLELALRLSPRDLTRQSLLQMLTVACVGACQYEKGVEYGTRGTVEFQAHAPTYANLAMCLVGLGEISKARAAMDEARRLEPEYVKRGLEGGFVFRKPEDLRRITTFLRVAAGLEDPSAADALR
jgi:adenylate cyclase